MFRFPPPIFGPGADVRARSAGGRRDLENHLRGQTRSRKTGHHPSPSSGALRVHFRLLEQTADNYPPNTPNPSATRKRGQHACAAGPVTSNMSPMRASAAGPRGAGGWRSASRRHAAVMRVGGVQAERVAGRASYPGPKSSPQPTISQHCPRPPNQGHVQKHRWAMRCGHRISGLSRLGGPGMPSVVDSHEDANATLRGALRKSRSGRSPRSPGMRCL